MRNPDLQEARDNAVNARFRELFEVQRLRHDDVMDTLSSEFFLTQKTVENILKGRKRDKNRNKTPHERRSETSPAPTDSAGTAAE